MNKPAGSSDRLYRSEENKLIAGVAGGLGEYFNIDPTIIRIIFIILTLFHGSGLLIYLVMWIVIPAKSQSSQTETVRANVEEIKNKAKSFAHQLKFADSSPAKNSRFYWAVLIIALGFGFLFNNFGLFDTFDLGRLWPIVLIAFGIFFILRK